MNYKLYNKIYRKVIRTAKKSYYDAKLAEYAKDVRNTWKIINTLISNKKNKHDIPGVFTEGTVNFTGAKEIAEGFNEYFVNVGPTLAEAIPKTNINYALWSPCCVRYCTLRTQYTETSTRRTSSQNVLAITENVYICLLCNLQCKYNLINVCLST